MVAGDTPLSDTSPKRTQFELNRGFLLMAILFCGGTATMPIWGRALYAVAPFADPFLLIMTFVILMIPGVYALFRVYLPLPLSEWLRGLREGKRETNLDQIRDKIRVKQEKEMEKERDQTKYLEEQRKQRVKEKGLSEVEREERQRERRKSKRRVKSGTVLGGIPSKKKKKRRSYFIKVEEIPEWHQTVLALDIDLVWRPSLYQVVGLAALAFFALYGAFFLIDFMITILWQTPSFMGISIERLQFFMTHPFSLDPETAHIYFDPEEYPNIKIALGLVTNPNFWFLIFFVVGFLVWLVIDEWVMALINQSKYAKAEQRELEKIKGIDEGIPPAV